MSRSSLFALVFITTLLPLAAQVPQVISQQGRIAVNGINFGGTGQFRFAFVNSTGSVTYWSNDGTSTAGSEPAAAVTIPVTDGHYSVDLGDTSLPNMAGLPDSLFDQGDLHLRVWFDGGTGSEQLTPDRRLTATPFTRLARRVIPGSITSESLASGSITSSHITAASIQNFHLRNGSVGTSQLAPNAVLDTHIVDNAIRARHLANGVITGSNLTADAVSAVHISDGAVQNAHLANSSVTRFKVAADAIYPVNLSVNSFNTTFWRTGGNVGTTGSHFLGTTDNQPLEFRVNGSRLLRLEGTNIIGGSSSNSATGPNSFVAGGEFNKANAPESFVAGSRAEARHSNCFVWAGGAVIPFPSIQTQTVSFYARNGFSIDWNLQTGNGRSNSWIFIGPGSDTIQTWTGGRLTNGGTWANSSDVNRKTDFAKVDPGTILEKVAALPIRQWRYKVEADEVRHLGPTAQDFRAAFGLGDDDKSIATVDADGVALAAIQALHRKLEAIRTENTRLRAENADFRRRLTLIEEKLAGLTYTTTN